jgi:hypothetical protein
LKDRSPSVTGQCVSGAAGERAAASDQEKQADREAVAARWRCRLGETGGGGEELALDPW